MEIILLEKVTNLGNIGDKVSVRPGYGRNFLIPTGKAVRATKASIADFEARKAELETVAAEKLKEAQARAEKLNGVKVSIVSKAGDEGKLFGSIGPREIADAATENGFELAKQEVNMPEGPIRVIGDFEVVVQVHPDVSATMTISIIAE